MRKPAKRGELWQVSCSVIWLHSPCRQRYRPIHSQVPGGEFVKRRAVIPLLLAASVVVSLWVAGPFGTIGFLLRAPIILMNDLISIARQAFASPSTSGVTVSPVSTTGLAASLNVVLPSTNAPPPPPQVNPVPTPPTLPPEVLVPPPNQILAPVEEILAPADPVLDPVQSAVDPIVDSVGKTLEPVTGPVENAAGSATEPVEKAAGGAVQDVKSALDKIGAP